MYTPVRMGSGSALGPATSVPTRDPLPSSTRTSRKPRTRRLSAWMKLLCGVNSQSRCARASIATEFLRCSVITPGWGTDRERLGIPAGARDRARRREKGKQLLPLRGVVGVDGELMRCCVKWLAFRRLRATLPSATNCAIWSLQSWTHRLHMSWRCVDLYDLV